MEVRRKTKEIIPNESEWESVIRNWNRQFPKSHTAVVEKRDNKLVALTRQFPVLEPVTYKEIPQRNFFGVSYEKSSFGSFKCPPTIPCQESSLTLLLKNRKGQKSPEMRVTEVLKTYAIESLSDTYQSTASSLKVDTIDSGTSSHHPRLPPHCFKRFVSRLIAILRVLESSKHKLWRLASQLGLGINIDPELMEQHEGTGTGVKSILSERERMAGSKPAEVRSPKQCRILRRALDRISCFSSYPPAMREKLSRVVNYQRFGPSRILVRQGRPPLNMYFILSGIICVTTYEKKIVHVGDYDEEHDVCFRITEVGPGNTIGDVPIMKKSTYKSTYSIKETCELFRLSKTDFKKIVKPEIKRQWKARYLLIRKFRLFKSLGERRLRSLAHTDSVIKEFEANTVIIGNENTAQHYHTYFITEGTCYIVRQILIITTTNKYGLPKPKLAPKGLGWGTVMRRHGNERCHVHTWVVGQIGYGKCFCAGEDLTKCYIVSKTAVKCLQFVRSDIARFGRLRTMETLRDVARNQIQTEKRTFELYLLHSRWRAYKDGLVQSVTADKKITNSMDNVPYSIKNQAKMFMAETMSW